MSWIQYFDKIKVVAYFKYSWCGTDMKMKHCLIFRKMVGNK